ncbi:hypothetical protein BHECKSOX2_1562 [Bathymodiolus heckerae thiotrophic gill symbiont]|nr:hypothetical protein [Bathymodiolus heckerae thiotrophic gill symbiont]SMN14165.1 hypothetical protein BHECKSOX2_1562 [Bathymodiolus heckerae thiotrophic gill symbiont]
MIIHIYAKVSIKLAKKENLELNDEYWLVLNFYNENGVHKETGALVKQSC